MSVFRSTRRGTTYREPTGNRAYVAIFIALVVAAVAAYVCITINNVDRNREPAPTFDVPVETEMLPEPDPAFMPAVQP